MICPYHVFKIQILLLMNMYMNICICIYIIYMQFLVFLNGQNARFYGGLKVSIIIEMRCHPSQR